MPLRGLLAALDPALARAGRRLRLAEVLPGALAACAGRACSMGSPPPPGRSCSPMTRLSSLRPASRRPTPLPPAAPERRCGPVPLGCCGSPRERATPPRGACWSRPPSTCSASFSWHGAAPWWDAAQSQPHLDTPATVEALRFWHRLRRREGGTVPVPGVADEVRWEPARILAGALRVAMACTWQPPAGRAAGAAHGGVVLRLVEPPWAVVRASLLGGGGLCGRAGCCA
jgi:hypothetical protein